MKLRGTDIGPQSLGALVQVFLLAGVYYHFEKVKIKRLEPIMASFLVINVEMIQNEDIVVVIVAVVAVVVLSRERRDGR